MIVSTILYVPALFILARPLVRASIAIQASPILLYLFYFFAGCGIGAASLDRGLLSPDGEMARRWPVWLGLTIASYGCIQALIYVKHSVLPDVNHQPL